ncbi:MAG TPA: BsuPI-related putative proteinase inhibitor [Myxococcales bacterium]|nr:BsuPI-related putative proteinase inhibitor [Myxococcales bacterium]
MRTWIVAGSVALAVAATDGGVAVTDAGADPIRLELALPSHVRAGEAVPLRLRVENVGGQPVDLYLRGRAPTLDVLVARASGEVVWSRLEGEIIPAIVQLRPLAPGERLELETVWNQRTKAGKRVGAGEYLVTGLLLVEDGQLSAPPRRLTITAR